MIFVAYLGIRLNGFRLADEAAAGAHAATAFDVLGCGAPVLIPRLAFNVMSENMLFVGLRGMMRDFLTLSALAIWSFAGFLLSIKWLHNDLHKVRAGSLTILRSTDNARAGILPNGWCGSGSALMPPESKSLKTFTGSWGPFS